MKLCGRKGIGTVLRIPVTSRNTGFVSDMQDHVRVRGGQHDEMDWTFCVQRSWINVIRSNPVDKAGFDPAWVLGSRAAYLSVRKASSND